MTSSNFTSPPPSSSSSVSLHPIQSSFKDSFFTPITPPSESSPSILSTAQTVLRAQADALSYIADLYEQDSTTQSQFFLSLQYMHNAILSNGKIVLTGMGKSYKIADKLVATMNSLGIHATGLHPSDALHGDLGVIKPTDVVIMITASGNTPELFSLLPHIPQGIPILCLTNTPNSPLAHKSSAVLSALIPKNCNEKLLYGLPAPTTSTTACLAVGDAVCITLAEMLISDVKERSFNFSKWHPGGAIGNDYKRDKMMKSDKNNENLLQTVTTVDHVLGDEKAKLNFIQSKVTLWEKVGIVSESDISSELSLLRKCAGKEWIFVASRYLIKTSDIYKYLDEVNNQQAKGEGNSEINLCEINSPVEKFDAFLVHKHSIRNLDSLDIRHLTIALILDPSESEYIGIYYNEEYRL